MKNPRWSADGASSGKPQNGATVLRITTIVPIEQIFSVHEALYPVNHALTVNVTSARRRFAPAPTPAGMID
jgi:hypothetical protein